MAAPDSFSDRWASRTLSILRVVVGVLFMQHGAMKLFGVPAGPGSGTVSLFSLMGVAGVLEFFGGISIVLGLFTRPVAFVLSGLMAVAYFMAHAPKGLLPLQNQGELAALYSFVFLYLSAAGGGAWSVDEFLRKGRSLGKGGTA